MIGLIANNDKITLLNDHTWNVEPHFRQIHRSIVIHGKLQCNLILWTVKKRLNKVHCNINVVKFQRYLILLGLAVLYIGEGDFKGVMLAHLNVQMFTCPNNGNTTVLSPQS